MSKQNVFAIGDDGFWSNPIAFEAFFKKPVCKPLKRYCSHHHETGELTSACPDRHAFWLERNGARLVEKTLAARCFI